MKLTVNTFVTLDGVMQGPGSADEDPAGGFTRGGWLVPYVDEGFGEVVDQWFAAGDAVLLGRTTYDLMSGFWPEVTDPEDTTAAALNGRAKYVVSNTLTEPGWENTTVVSGDAVEQVRALKEELGEGELQVHGSAPEHNPSAPLTTRKAPRIGKSFSSRNPLPIGAIGLVFILVLLVAAFNAASLPLIGGGTTYKALFSESANLKPTDEVRIAGVKVGEVQDVSISGTKVLVTFTVKDGWVGNDSTAYIKIKTLLGAKYLGIDSKGTAAQDTNKTMTDTVTPLDVYPAFTDITNTVDNLNTDNLAKSLRTLADDFQGTPKYVAPLVTGLSRLSTTISSRDVQLQQLLASAQQVTGILADRSQDLQKVLSDGNLLLNELNARRDAIHSLLVNTQILSVQLRGLVADNQKTIGPLLESLDKVLATLQKNQDSLERGLSLLGPFYRVFNNVIGNGRWFDNYIQNLGASGVLGLLAGSPGSILPTLPKLPTGGLLPTISLPGLTGGK